MCMFHYFSKLLRHLLGWVQFVLVRSQSVVVCWLIVMLVYNRGTIEVL